MAIQTIKDIETIERTPLTEALPFTNTWDTLKAAGEQYSDKPALTFFMFGQLDEVPFTWTYADLLRDITKTANAFHAMGVREDAPVSIILPNFPESHFAIWGAEAAGVANPINPFLEPEHMAGIMRAAGTKVVVTLAPNPMADIYAKVLEAVKEVETVKHIIVVNPSTYFPPGMPSLPANYPTPNGVEVVEFSEILRDYPGDTLSFERIIASETRASLFHTGGTTGVPKLAPHTHLNETYMGWAFNTIMGETDERVMLCGLPLFHVNGVIVTGLGAFANGAHIILATPQGYRSQGLMQNFWKIIERYKVNTFSGVPTILSMLLSRPVDADISSLDFVICGAAPLSPELFKTFRDTVGVEVVEAYGLTEGTCGSTINPIRGEKRVGSVGLRIPYQEIKAVILDHESNILRDCGVDEPGVLVMKGPQVFPGYTDASKNDGVLLSDGWMSTGDLGRIDAEGYVWLTGRAKDLIIRGGHNIDPSVIEDVLAEHPAVAMAAAVGQPDAHAGELPVAFVTVTETAEPDELAKFAKERITERAAAPVRVEILTDMPVTAVGKIFKPTLREMAAGHVVKEVLKPFGLAAEHISVARDPAKGLCAYITAEPKQSDAIHEALAGYHIHVTITE